MIIKLIHLHTFGLGGSNIAISVMTPKVPSDPMNNCFKSYPNDQSITRMIIILQYECEVYYMSDMLESDKECVRVYYYVCLCVCLCVYVRVFVCICACVCV